MDRTLEQMKELWYRMNPRQRMVLVGGAAVTVAAVIFFVRMFASTDFKPLMTGLEPEEAQAIVQQLMAKKIEAKVSVDGREVDVDASKLDAARMEVASSGGTHSGRMGFEIFDKATWGQTEFDEKVNYQRALEGELERTIATLKGVKSARVHLVMAHDSVFLDNEKAAKASVTLRFKRGSLNAEQLEAIARLVSGAVENLSPADVAIIDADSNQPLNGHNGMEQAHELEDQLTKRLMTTLGAAVGVENIRAAVNVEYETASSEESRDIYDPAVSALLTTQKSSQRAAGAGDAGGVAGTSGNLPGDPAQSSNGDGGSQSSISESSTYGVNKTERHTVSPAGAVRRITAAVLVNDAPEKKLVDGKMVTRSARRSPEQMTELQGLATAVLGLNTQRGDSVKVENMTFAGAEDDAASPTIVERVRRGASDFAEAIRYAGLVVVFLLVWALIYKPTQKQLFTWMKELPERSAPVTALPQAAGVAKLRAEPAEPMLAADVNSVGLKRKLAEMVQAEPAAMTKTVQTWLQES
jgi:flagellar M-ring protein FliF